MAGGKFVSYLRVSTERQGRSGLGLEAQRAAVEQYLNGGQWQLVAEYVEVETGKRSDRPELARALAHCRRAGATLIIAKLDRLARNVAFVANLMESGADFVACDFPQANRLTIHILAAVAEHEAKMISERTRAALAAAKARGVKLGNPNGAAALRAAGKGNRAALATIQTMAQKRAADYRDVLEDLAGHSLQAAARALNARGILAPRGGAWTATAVRRFRERMGVAPHAGPRGVWA
jgi:DNA invertase Pin-like site-specific DNA recombinase